MADRDTNRVWWHELIRIGLTAAWVATLTLWSYYQGLWFYSGVGWRTHALRDASVFLRTIDPMWWVCFFSALAFGVGFYTFAHRPQRGGARTPSPYGLTRFATYQAPMTLCLGICVYLLNWRVLPLLPLTTSGVDRASPLLLQFEWASVDMGRVPLALELQLLIAALGAGVVFLQAWSLVPRLGGSRLRLVLLVTIMLAVGSWVPMSGLLRELHSPEASEIISLDTDGPVERGLLMGDRNYDETAAIALARYFQTHDDLGHVLSYQALQGNWWDWHREVRRGDYAEALCELCRLPGVQLWTTSGLHVLLGDGPEPNDTEPGAVVEVPRRAVAARVYDPVPGAPITVVEVEDLLSVIPASDWLVVKIDWAVPMRNVVRLLDLLRTAGVRRVDLAVMPHGYVPIPSAPVRLVLNGTDVAYSYHPRQRPPQGRERVRLRPYLPPPPVTYGPGCDEVFEYWDAMAGVLDDPGTVPEGVSITVEEEMEYGRFIGILQGAVSGGATRIAVVLTQPSD
jgi:biopolymer transport protein ExbD